MRECRSCPCRATVFRCLVGALILMHPVAAAATPKLAQRGTATANPSYKELLSRAAAAESAQDLPTATRLLGEAYRQSPRPEVLYHLGRIAMSEGHKLEAHDLFRRYLADPAREADEAASQTAEQLTAQPLPPSGSVSVLSDPGALVLVDGRLIGTLPLPLPLLLTPGQHTIALEFLDKRLESSVVAQAGRLIELRLSRASGTVLVSVLPALLLFADLDGLPADAPRRLGDSLEQAARSEQYTVLRVERALGAAPELRDSLGDDRAQRQLAQRNSVDFLLRLRALSDGKEWKLGLSLLHTDIESAAAEQEVSCAACTVDQAAAKLKDAAAKLFSDGLSRPRGTVRFTAEPEDATVRISGQFSAHRAPATATLWAGSYEATISRRGYAEERRSIEVSDGNQTELRVRLSRKGAPARAALPPAPSPAVEGGRPKWRLGVGATLISLGAGFSIAGGLALGWNGQCVESPAAEGGACPRLYSTQRAGDISLGLGAALLASGIVLVALPGRARTAAKPKRALTNPVTQAMATAR